MLQAPTPQTGPSLILIEAGLTVIALALTFAWPGFVASWFARIERALGALARRQGLSVVVVGLCALALRVAILPLCPRPLPFLPDDFSFLLSGDTFAHGRLANPTPAMWVHLETIHVTMRPTYASMYFPGQGLALAAGQLLFGHPWYGILVTGALMCAAICWMLQAWLPPSWALLGGALAIMRLGLFSYWINSYTGGGQIGALGGALVLGALPRLMKKPRLRYGVLLAIGTIATALTRPYEGLLLCIPVAAVLGHWILFAKKRPSPARLLRSAAIPLALLVAAGAWQGYYNYRAFGSPTTLPYSIDRATYAVTPYFVWQPLRPDPVYHHAELRGFYHAEELFQYEKVHSPTGFVRQSLLKAIAAVLFFAGITLLPPLIMLRRVLSDHRIRFLVYGLLIMSAGMLIEIYIAPHYVSPFTASFYAVGLQCMRHLRVWKPGCQPVGAAMVRFTVVLCLLMAGLRAFAVPLNLPVGQWPGTEWRSFWYGPADFGEERARLESSLEQLPGKQLAIVRYSSSHDPTQDWVVNGADIDGSKVLWAREMDAADNLELMEYYRNRRAWLVEPDAQPPRVSPYPTAEKASSASSKSIADRAAKTNFAIGSNKHD
ncbi:MAG: hypothetical protein WBE76_21245 [Terracidiphilus sp.]